MSETVEEARAMLALFVRSPWRELHVRTGGCEMFLARPGGGRNPMTALAAETADSAIEIDAPHLGLFFAGVAAGAAVDADSVIGQLEVLGEREDIVAGRAGRVLEMLVADGALVEYSTPLARIMA